MKTKFTLFGGIALLALLCFGVYGFTATTGGDEEDKKKKIEITIENGVKKMTVTTIENGKKKVETFEGDEVDEYLEKHGTITSSNYRFHHPKHPGVRMRTFNINTNKDDNTGKRVEVKEENGVKKVTVTTVVDGEEKVEYYEGEDAEKYLKENPSCENMAFDFDFDFDFDDDHFAHAFAFDGETSEEVREKIKEAMEQVKESMSFMDFDFNFDSDDSTHFFHFNGSPNAKIMYFDSDDFMDMDDLFEDMDIDVEEYFTEENGKRVKKVVITKTVVVEDIDEEETAKKELKVDDLSFFPNPSDGRFTLQFKTDKSAPVNIVITDVQGKEIYRDTVEGKGKHKLAIDISNHESGIYILNLLQGKRSKSKKIVVK